MSVAEYLNIDTNLAYNPGTLDVNQPLNITNVSEHQLAYKIKTNKKNFISMNPCNGFIKPFTTMSIPVKIVQQVPESVSIKLEVNWCVVTPEMKQKNDIKMATANQKNIQKKIFPIVRKQQKFSAELISNVTPIEQKEIIVPEVKKVQKQQRKITPFQYEKKEVEQQSKAQSPKKVEPSPTQQSTIKQKPLKQQQEQITDEAFQYRSANNMLASLSSPNSLEIVSQEDQQDHEKQLQQVRNQQVEELRLIDEIKSRARKTTQEIKSTEVLDNKLLLLVLVGCFLLGSFVQYLIF